MQIINIIKLRSFNSKSLDKANQSIISKANKFDLTNISKVNLKKKKKKFTLLKSPHVHKKAREQFELCVYKSVIICGSKVKA